MVVMTKKASALVNPIEDKASFSSLTVSVPSPFTSITSYLREGGQ
jgi:hypothetical protein